MLVSLLVPFQSFMLVSLLVTFKFSIFVSLPVPFPFIVLSLVLNRKFVKQSTTTRIMFKPSSGRKVESAWRVGTFCLRSRCRVRKSATTTKGHHHRDNVVVVGRDGTMTDESQSPLSQQQRHRSDKV